MLELGTNPLVVFPVILGDRRTPLGVRLLQGGAVVDLTGHTVAFTMYRDQQKTKKVDAAAMTVSDATAGECNYPWAAADVDEAGTFWGYIVITETATGLTDTFPVDGRKLQILVVDKT